MRWLWLLLLWLTLLVPAYPGDAEERLILIGGGDHPREAMAQFSAWGGEEKARILVIAWASEEPDASLEVLRRDFVSAPPAKLELAPQAPLDGASRSRLLSQLADASAVWFTGGDQVKVMRVLQDKELLEALRAKYRGGTVFGGTSAGTAIMSQRMLTGEADLTLLDGRQVKISPGLGLLPYHLIVDQHFLKRQRHNRLLGLILENPDAVGLGIDEDTALVVTEGRRARVVGPSQVMLVEPQGARSLRLRFFGAGDQFELPSR